MTFWETIAVATVPALITSILAYFKLRQEFNMYKTEVMAERAAKRLLKHKGYTDRSFGAIKDTLGGWDDEEDELRKILVRAGAVRTFRDGDRNQEWWYLLSRTEERIERKKR
ncbi:hypothetical protein QQ008_22215 [Fulvivirgaceae bacterium BMA10]|uniref:Uncharacterized protein n=1 Tax=Splendidivirga corallicola TaxID=3051826 RepID=A0ABT8KTP1_9BACT|nr:hypothetical protein [Fulvivirgaceae bacterium BMA10]